MVVLVGCDCRVGSVNCCCLSTTSPMPAPYRSASSRRATWRPRTSTACPVCPPYHLYSDPYAIRSEMTMGQRVTGHGSSGSTNLSGSRGSRDSTCDPLTHDQVNKIPRTGYFDVWFWEYFHLVVLTGNCNSRESWLVSSRESRVTRATGQKVWRIVISGYDTIRYGTRC